MKGRLIERAQAWTMLVLLLVAAYNPVYAARLASYWGQNGNEGTLADACASGNYDILMLAFLYRFGNGQTPVLDLAGHCNAAAGECTGLVSDVESCQRMKVKIILSLGGAAGSCGFSSAQEAENLAQYLWDNFLGGSSSSSPLGAAHLDGIDLDIESGGSQYYPNLITSLRNIATYKLYITAAPQCRYPDDMLGPGDDTALSTQLDFVFVQFYNNYCGYQGGLDQLVTVWNRWSGALSTAQVFLGLPASPEAAESGYVEPSTLLDEILPKILTASNYGGVMLWNVHYDQENNLYSAQIRNRV